MIKSCWLVLLIVLSVGCGSTEMTSVKSAPYTGRIAPSKLLSDYPNFAKEYQAYQPKEAEVIAAQSLSGKSILVLFGIWCHDSQREVPRLLKSLDISAIKLKEISLYGVNYNKQEPSNLHREYGLKFSPTIILFDGEKELGRIVEKPTISLAQDLAKLINPSLHR